MSDHLHHCPNASRGDRRDEGMTLTELLITMVVLGVIVTVVAAAVVVTMRQAPEASDRATVARWEQNLGTWLPGDLASATWPTDTPEDPDSPDDPDEAVDNPDYEPCATAECTWGENILHLNWYEDADLVDVSYRYGEDGAGGYHFRRIECRNGSCESITLVREMPPPSSGGDAPIAVSFPPDILSTDPNGSEIVDTSGRRVSVTVKSLDGTDMLSFTGGGTELVDLEPAAIQPPQFLQARSGCGGPITLLADESLSLSDTAVEQVKTAVKSFVETFAGTPTQLQIIGFGNRSRTLGTSAWNKWYDLSDQSVVTTLTGSSSPINSLDNNGYTNWEDAFYRAFYTETGQTYQALGNPANPPSELIVFFTDGVPTYDRADSRAAPAPSTPGVASGDLPSKYNAHYGSGDPLFDPRAWYRASWLLEQHQTEVIAVGVGDAFTKTINLNTNTNLGSKVADWGSSTVPVEVVLGDLVAGNDLSTYAGDATNRYVKVEADGAGNFDPNAVGSADILTTTDFDKFGGALEAIALAECGGTLTVQTRKSSDGTPVSPTITYEVTGVDVALTESSTSAVSKTAVFDIATESALDTTVLLKPRSFEGTGFEPTGWQCRLRNVPVTDPSKVDPVSADPLDGINLTISANEALACVLLVQPA